MSDKGLCHWCKQKVARTVGGKLRVHNDKSSKSQHPCPGSGHYADAVL